jgi:hypothetical protein
MKGGTDSGADADSDPAVRTWIVPDDSDQAERLGSGLSWRARIGLADSDLTALTRISPRTSADSDWAGLSWAALYRAWLDWVD